MTRVCTKCGEQLTREDESDGLEIEYRLGYFTNYDLRKLKYKFCIKCTDEEVAHKVQECKHNPLEDYGL